MAEVSGAGWRVPGFSEVRELGAGSQGRVVLADATDGGGVVAIKYLPPELLSDHAHTAMFRAEAATLSRLADPHVARLHRYVETAEGAAIVMEAVDGISLRLLLAERAPLAPEGALAILKGSLLGLAAAHAVGIVHRDYKPGNVLVLGDGTSKLVDFGIAVLAGEGSRAGTPAYMAPEQWRGDPASPMTDVYAATCVFFEAVSGHRPYAGDGLMGQHLDAPVPVDDVPEQVRFLVARGMAKEAIQRPPGAAAFVTELEAVAASAYGPDWERRGVEALALAAAGLSTLFPLAALGLRPLTRLGGTAVRKGLLGTLGSHPVIVGVAAAAVVAVGAGAAVAAIVSHDSAHASASQAGRTTALPGPATTSASATATSATPAPVVTITQVPPPTTVTTPVTDPSSPSAPALVTVPDVTGGTPAAATNTLSAAGLRATVVVRTTTRTAAGLVDATSPAAGAQVAAGSAVTVYVAKAPAVLVVIPPVTQKCENQATADITAAGLHPVVAYTGQRQFEIGDGEAFGTTPATGTKVPKGSTVTVHVYRAATPDPFSC